MPKDLEQRFIRQLQDNRTLSPGERVLLAISGGPDSVALAHLFCRTADRLGVTLCAGHVDHAIRPESAIEVETVRSLCARLDLPLFVQRHDVPHAARQWRVGLEEAGRRIRYAAFAEMMTEAGATCVALGHHRDDQAETVLHHLLRGAAVEGLAAMRPRRCDRLRPLLLFTKAELSAYLHGLGATFCEDASNNDCRFTRNRIRHDLLPQLERYNPQIRSSLTHLAAAAARDADYWAEEVERRLAGLLKVEDGVSVLTVSALMRLHPALRLRILKTALERATDREIGGIHLENLEQLLQQGTPQCDLDLPGLKLSRRYDRLWLCSAKKEEQPPWSLTIAGPGEYLLPDGRRLLVEPALAPFPLSALPTIVFLSAASLNWPLQLRSPLPGDRIVLPNLPGRKRLKELFAEARIPREERRIWPVLAAREILWVPGLRSAATAIPRPGEPAWRFSLVGV